VPSRPRDALGIAQLQEQLELFGEQLVVVAQVVAEKRERLDERASAGHDLRATVRDQVERGEVLEDAHGVVGAQNRDRARQADVFRADRRGRQRDGRRGDRVVGAVVLADAENFEAELIRQLNLLEKVAQPPCRVDLGPDVGEGVETKFHSWVPFRPTFSTSSPPIVAPKPRMGRRNLRRRAHPFLPPL
jgi:hypothetical protein